MKKVIIAVDYSPNAEKIAEKGYMIGKAVQADITIVHVIHTEVYHDRHEPPTRLVYSYNTSGAVGLGLSVKAEAETFLMGFVNQIGDDSIGIKVLEGDIIDSILRYSEEQKADLLVVGAHKHVAFDRLIQIDMAVQALRQTSIPLMIVPPPITSPAPPYSYSEYHSH